MATSRRDKADSYTQKAHREGYPARSVYKLQEINAAHRLIKPGDTVLDVGAAPGSWTLFTHRELIKGRGRIVSVDLNPLSLDPIPPTVTEFTGDAFSAEIRAKLVENGPYDAIISDAAPMTTGNRIVYSQRQRPSSRKPQGMTPSRYSSSAWTESPGRADQFFCSVTVSWLNGISMPWD